MPHDLGGSSATVGNHSPQILVLMGVSGSGKSTVAWLLVNRLGWDFAEGDDMHPWANRHKMAAGHPLTDEDRWPWLDRIAAWIHQHLDEGRRGIVTSSALKRVYRDRLRAPGVVFVHLTGSQKLLVDRLKQRTGHFMPPSLLQSQLDTLEPPDDDEAALTVDISHEPDAITDEILRDLDLSGVQPRAEEARHRWGPPLQPRGTSARPNVGSCPMPTTPSTTPASAWSRSPSASPHRRRSPPGR